MVYKVIDEEVFLAPSNKNKAFCLHKLQFDDGREEFRIAYYMIAHKPRMKGKWAYGQFAPMMTSKELALILQKAKSKGIIDKKLLGEFNELRRMELAIKTGKVAPRLGLELLLIRLAQQ